METEYIKTKNGNILECYVSEEMKKPIYYPIESKTNGAIDGYGVVITDKYGFETKYKYGSLKKENEILTKNAEHNDKVVDKVNWENMFLKDKLKKIEQLIENYSCIYKKGFPNHLLLVVRGDIFEENQYLELDTVLNDFEKIIKGDD